MLPRRNHAIILLATLVLLVILTSNSMVVSPSVGWRYLFSSSSSSRSSNPVATVSHGDVGHSPSSSDSSLESPVTASTSAATRKTKASVPRTAAPIFSASFLKSDDAAGQVWDFTELEQQQQREDQILQPRTKQKTHDEIISEYKACTGTGTVSGIPNATDAFIASQTTPQWHASDADIEAICAKRGSSVIRESHRRPLLIYGALFGFEVDIVEIVLHEALPVVDAMVLIESSATHSLNSKPLVFQKLLKSRLKRFADRVAMPSAAVNNNIAESPAVSDDAALEAAPWFGKRSDIKIFPRIFEPRRKEKSGWTVEKKQRREFQRAIPLVLRHLNGVVAGSAQSSIEHPPPVIIIAQLDLDEIPSRETLLYWKHCERPLLPLRVIWLRFHLECQQELPHSKFWTTIFRMKASTDRLDPNLDLYSMRRAVSRLNNSDSSNNAAVSSSSSSSRLAADACAAFHRTDNTAWHLSAFGGVASVRRKNKHSPHAFVRREPQHNLENEIRNCFFSGKTRWKLPVGWWACDGHGVPRTDVMPVALPHFVAENVCVFTRRGWMS